MKTFIVAIVMALMFASSASAKPVSPSGSLQLDQAAPAFGDTISFTATYANVPRCSYWGADPTIEYHCVFVYLTCYQTTDVYSESRNLDFYKPSFILRSPLWTSGPASCIAKIGYYNQQPWRFILLDQVEFNVTS